MENYDLVIIGAGAAGLTAALYGARGGLSCLIFDCGLGGGQALEIETLENYPGIYPAFSGSEIIENLIKQIGEFDIKIKSAPVSSIDKKGELFSVKTSKEEFCAYSVILATGAKHLALGAKGEKEFAGRGVSYCAVCDGPFFKNKNVFVIGGGDSALSEALYLSKIASHVTIVHRRNEFRGQKTLSDRIFKNEKISVLFDSVVKEIFGGDKSKNGGGVNSVQIENVISKKSEIYSCDAVFVFVGMAPEVNLIENLKKDEKGFVVTNEDMSTLVSGLYCAGDVRSKPLRQIVTACSDGAVAAFSAGNYISQLKNKLDGSAK